MPSENDLAPAVKSRVSQVLRLTLLQIVSGTVVGGAFLDRRNPHAAQNLLIVMGPIVSATLIMVATSAALPTLLPRRPIAFPQTVALPILFVLLVRASEILWISSQSAVFRPPDALLPALEWARPEVLGVLAALQFVLLSGWSLGHKAVRPRT